MSVRFTLAGVISWHPNTYSHLKYAAVGAFRAGLKPQRAAHLKSEVDFAFAPSGSLGGYFVLLASR